MYSTPHSGVPISVGVSMCFHNNNATTKLRITSRLKGLGGHCMRCSSPNQLSDPGWTPGLLRKSPYDFLCYPGVGVTEHGPPGPFPMATSVACHSVRHELVTDFRSHQIAWSRSFSFDTGGFVHIFKCFFFSSVGWLHWLDLTHVAPLTACYPEQRQRSE